MGDSTCLMQPFSYASGIPNEAHEGNPVHALGHSVSFGRFMTESLDWEKWSSFSHNRYVEEAERYAQPGSVAQKKAFFEAHYKKVAAQRAAALLEQANAAAKSNNADPPKPRTMVPAPPKYMICEQELREKVKQRNGVRKKAGLDQFESIEIVKVADLVSEEEAEDTHREEEAVLVDTSGYNSSIDPQREEGAAFVDTSGYNSSIEMENCERVHPITEYPALGENSAVAELSTPMQETHTHKEETVMELEHSVTLQMEKPLLKESRRSDQEASVNQKKIIFSSKSSLLYHKAPKAPSSPSKTTAPCFPRRKSNATPLHKAPKTPTSPSKLTTPFPRRESNATPLLKVPKAPTSPARPTASCFPRREGNATPLHKAHKGPTSPAKPTASCFPRRESNGTPLHKKLSTASEDKKRSTPKSMQKSVSFTPIRELSRFTSTVMRKIENSRVGTSSSKTPKDSSILLKTPTMVSKNEVHKHPSLTPCSEKRRAKTPGDPTSVTGGKTFGPNWRSIRTENKAQSPFSSASFSLRTEERAASRKKKLEEKFNANEILQVQEKAELEIRKFRQSLCFKARPLPDFYKERKAPLKDEVKKVPVSNSQTAVGKKHSPRGAISVPPNESSFKSSGSRHAQIQARSKETPTCSLITRSLKAVHENTSPNIQSS
ncbi:protein WVD2-like 7 isoform X2 [Argentina anserina]|uniref:protein WVD2-like 7 isoform X2 n=1 Tax=Argentina anserina TaxID=57926 RepID=UPI0021769468|nr:protein WVD2-like 7 isoform X2 [Potentilla anserina]